MATPEVLFDVNVFEDVLTGRQGVESSSQLLNLVRVGALKGWISSTTPLILYFLRRKRGEKEALARKRVKAILEGFSIVPFRKATFDSALKGSLPEFEDNIQIASALIFRLDAIITRNKKHFVQKDIPVYNPEEYLSNLQKKLPTKKGKVYFLDLRAQHHTIYNRIDDGITDVITSCRFVLGEHVERFESSFARFQDTRYCVALNSGTSALHCALLALGVGEGDEVITVPHTFIATAEAISYVGARPAFVDIDEQFYTLSPSKFEEFVEKKCEFDGHLIHRSTGRRIRAIIPVHLYGQPADMEPILQVAQKYNLEVIEDCAQAHGAEYKVGNSRRNCGFRIADFGLGSGRGAGVRKRKDGGGKANYGWVRVGGLGDIGCFSFYPGKNLGAYGEGGAVVTNNEEIAVKVRMIRDHGQPRKYYHDMIGYNYRMDAFQGVVLNAKLEHLKEWTRRRRENAALYNELLKDVEEVITPKEMPYAKHVYHLYVIRCKNRDQLQEFLNDKGIATGLHYPIPLHLQKAYAFLGHKRGDFPVAERVAGEILSLPMFPELTQEQIKYVAGAIKDFYADR